MTTEETCGCARITTMLIESFFELYNGLWTRIKIGVGSRSLENVVHKAGQLWSCIIRENASNVADRPLLWYMPEKSLLKSSEGRPFCGGPRKVREDEVDMFCGAITVLCCHWKEISQYRVLFLEYRAYLPRVADSKAIPTVSQESSDERST